MKLRYNFLIVFLVLFLAHDAYESILLRLHKPLAYKKMKFDFFSRLTPSLWKRAAETQ